MFGFHRQSDASPRRHARTAAPDGRRQQSGGGQAAGRMTPSLLYTVVVTRRRRRVTSFAFPPGDAPMGASSDSTDNTAARTLALEARATWRARPRLNAPAPACRRLYTAGELLEVGYPASAAGPARRK